MTRSRVRSSAVHHPSRAVSSRPAAALLIAALVALLASESAPASQSADDFLAANIDATVSPRDDFYLYANGEWLKRNPIPDYQARWGVWNVASQAVYEDLRQLSERAAAADAPRGSAARLIGDVWVTGMDADRINADGLRHLQPDLQRIADVRSLGDLIEVVAVLHRRNILSDNYFTRQRVMFDGAVVAGDTGRWDFHLAPGGLSIGRLAYSGNGDQQVRAKAALRDYLVSTFVRLHADAGRARTSAEAVMALEERLAAGIESDAAPRSLDLAALGRLTPAIDWNRYFRRLGATAIPAVTVGQARFFQELNGLLGDAPLEDWKDYLRFWLIKTNAPFLDDGTFGEFFTFKSVMTSQPEPPPRWRRVVWQERNWLGLPLEFLYGREHWPPVVLARYRSVGESVRLSFQERIEQAAWLDAGTKEQALRKLARLRLTIGSPKPTVDFSTMPLKRDAYVLNMIRSAEWFHDVAIGRLGTAVDDRNADLHPAAGGGDAEYVFARNEVRLTNPTIAPGRRVEDLDDAVVYGATPLGHEIAHGFENDGRQYDADGRMVDWWTSRDAAAFDERVDSMVEHYNAYMRREGRDFDARLALGEELATLIGLRIKLDAFKRTEEYRRGERIGGFTPLQRFFLSFAYANAAHARTNLGRAPDHDRVNFMVATFPEFYEAFDVKPGDRMHLPESARRSIW